MLSFYIYSSSVLTVCDTVFNGNISELVNVAWKASIKKAHNDLGSWFLIARLKNTSLANKVGQQRTE